MIKKKALIAAVLLVLALVLMTGCSSKSSDDQYQIVFGASATELIPTVGNAAYVARSLTGGDEESPTYDADTTTATAEDNYVDPTAGLDCSEE